MGRTFVGGRALIARVGGPGQLRLGPGQPVGQLRDLAGKLQDDSVLLLDVPLQEREAFLESALAFIHAGKMKAAPDRASPHDVYGRYPARTRD